jgi:hypothetical protein
MAGDLMENGAGYLVRYGAMGHVGVFTPEAATGFALRRGQEVVIRTHRGEEVGEVLVRLDRERPAEGDPAGSLLLRPATASDLDRARRCTTLRAERFEECGRVLGQEGWPLELIDVETLLDQETTVIHYLGPSDLDLAILRARFRTSSGFDVVFEPAGLDPGPPPTLKGEGAGGRCGDCDCSGGGCGSNDGPEIGVPAARPERDGVASSPCDSSAHSDCSSCGISKWAAGRRRPDD